MIIASFQNLNNNFNKYSSPAFGNLGLFKKFPRSYAQNVDTFIGTLAEAAAKKTREPLGLDGLLLEAFRPMYFDDSKGNFLCTSIFWGQVPSGKFCIFLHGGTSNVENYRGLYESLVKKNITVIPLEYAGYGCNRRTRANFDNVMGSAEDLYDYLTRIRLMDPKNISILGYCMGGQVAANLASKVKCDSLFLVNPLTHLTDMSDGYLKSKNYQKSFVERCLDKISYRKPFAKYKILKQMNAYDNAENINCPVYIVSSKSDAVMYPKFIKKFADKLRSDGVSVEYIPEIGDSHKFTEEKIEFVTSMLQDRLITDTDYLIWKNFGFIKPGTEEKIQRLAKKDPHSPVKDWTSINLINYPSI